MKTIAYYFLTTLSVLTFMGLDCEKPEEPVYSELQGVWKTGCYSIDTASADCTDSTADCYYTCTRTYELPNAPAFWDNCLEDPDPDAGGGIIFFKFNGNTFKRILAPYDNGICSGGTFLRPTYTIEGTFEIGETFTTDSGETAKKINFYTSIAFEGSDQVSRTLNASYNIFIIEKDQAGSGSILFLGDVYNGKNGSTDALRPTDINKNEVTTKYSFLYYFD